jgi:hypothetical protein
VARAGGPRRIDRRRLGGKPHRAIAARRRDDQGVVRLFTVEERDRIRARLLEKAQLDPRIVAAAEVGSLALGPGDRWSDIDLSLGLAAGVTVAEILAAWTPEIEREFDAVALFDLPYQSTVYRVFFFPGSLQVDLSFAPGHEFGALGPQFKLLFGEAVTRPAPASPTASHRFGLAVHHALRARFSIERGRFWQAEYWISALRDESLALACSRRGLTAGHARGYDELPEEVRSAHAGTLVRSLDRAELMRALGVAIEGLLRESDELAKRVEAELRALARGV